MRALVAGLAVCVVVAAPAAAKTIAVEAADGTESASIRIERTIAVKGVRTVTALATWAASQTTSGLLVPAVNPDVTGSLSLICGTSWQKRSFTKNARIVIPPRSRQCTIGVAFSVFQRPDWDSQGVNTSLRVTLGAN